ncbi:MAG: diacylglycerol kinase family protein [Thermotaleaceae bacterium]
MKTLFIVNPTAGKGKALKPLGYIHQKLEEREISFDIKITKEKGEAEKIARWAAAEDYEKVVALGGDGTIYEILNGLIGRKTALGVIPLGTGNDFVKTMHIPHNIEEALDIVIRGRKKRIDCGKANERYFMNVASIGLDAEIVQKTESIKQYISGPTAYVAGVFKTLFQYQFQKLAIDIDGLRLEEKITLLAIGNGKYYGGGMKVTPDAQIDDGYFSICLIKELGKLKILSLFPTIFTGEHIKEPVVKLYRGKEISVRSEGPLLVNVDGDIIGKTPVIFELVEKAIDVIVP